MRVADLPPLSKSDQIREAEIGFVQSLLVIETDPAQKRALLDEFHRLLKERTPEQINTMEVIKGLV